MITRCSRMKNKYRFINTTNTYKNIYSPNQISRVRLIDKTKFSPLVHYRTIQIGRLIVDTIHSQQ